MVGFLLLAAGEGLASPRVGVANASTISTPHDMGQNELLLENTVVTPQAIIGEAPAPFLLSQSAVPEIQKGDQGALVEA
ncbi:MAG: hypothetical protein F6K65_43435, partial [Moorea sp. SIO3C2]|nr:hypothetical protein [Moorena sp. SIO3C2]